jgi:Uma2 family endonuclease
LQHEPDTVLAPAVALIDKHSAASVGIDSFYFQSSPLLAIEVMSEDDGAEEFNERTWLWLESGVEALWVINPKARGVTVLGPQDNGHLLSEQDTLDGDVVPGFSVQVAELFAGLTP